MLAKEYLKCLVKEARDIIKNWEERTSSDDYAFIECIAKVDLRRMK